MKILLINPTNSVNTKSDFTVNIFQPLGLAYIAAILEHNKYEVKILDALAEGFNNIRQIKNKKVIGMNYKDIKKTIKSFNPDIVGITTPFSVQSQEAHKMAELTKQVNKNIITIAGGTHATIQPEEMLNDKNVDYVIRGEGEKAILKLIKQIENKQSVKKVKNLSYRNKKGKIINNPKSNPIINLDKIPFPARHLLPIDKYFQAAKKGIVIEGLLAFGKKRTGIFTSRGCPFTCTFCSVNLTMTRVWRSRSPENVFKELKECVEKYNIKYFDFLDDNFTLDINRAKKICQLIIKNKLKIQWSTPNGIRADRLDNELVILMKKAGCIQVKLAPESGNQKVLTHVIKKNLDLSKVKEAVSLCKKHKLSVEAFFVIGFPEETVKNIMDTINYAKELRKLGCDFCYFFIATPYYGTEMYNTAIKNGYLDVSKYKLNEILTTTNKLLLKSPNYTPKKLMELQKLASQINPPITKTRFWAGIYMFLLDPLRILKFAISYFKNFLN